MRVCAVRVPQQITHILKNSIYKFEAIKTLFYAHTRARGTLCFLVAVPSPSQTYLRRASAWVRRTSSTIQCARRDYTLCSLQAGFIRRMLKGARTGTVDAERVGRCAIMKPRWVGGATLSPLPWTPGHRPLPRGQRTQGMFNTQGAGVLRRMSSSKSDGRVATATVQAFNGGVRRCAAILARSSTPSARCPRSHAL